MEASVSTDGSIDLAEAWHARETLLREGIPPKLREAAVARATALRGIAMHTTFRRFASTLISIAIRPIRALGRRAWTGARHLRAG